MKNNKKNMKNIADDMNIPVDFFDSEKSLYNPEDSCEVAIQKLMDYVIAYSKDCGSSSRNSFWFKPKNIEYNGEGLPALKKHESNLNYIDKKISELKAYIARDKRKQKRKDRLETKDERREIVKKYAKPVAYVALGAAITVCIVKVTIDTKYKDASLANPTPSAFTETIETEEISTPVEVSSPVNVDESSFIGTYVSLDQSTMIYASADGANNGTNGYYYEGFSSKAEVVFAIYQTNSGFVTVDDEEEAKNINGQFVAFGISDEGTVIGYVSSEYVRNNQSNTRTY